MKVHLVSIKVGVVGSTDTLIETERPIRHDTSLRMERGRRERGWGKEKITIKTMKCIEPDHMYMCTDQIITHIVRHDAQLVQRGLTVEENHVTIDQVTLNNVPML